MTDPGAEWGDVIKILCAKAGPTCDCGSYSSRTRRLPHVEGRLLMAVRCEGCGHVHALDALDPGAVVDMSQDVPQVAHQDSLF